MSKCHNRYRKESNNGCHNVRKKQRQDRKVPMTAAFLMKDKIYGVARQTVAGANREMFSAVS